MKVYFYHTQDIQYILRRMDDGEFPPHYLYGASKLGAHGIDVVWHQARVGLPRWRMMLRNTWCILTCKEQIDAVYAIHYRGIEPLVLLRALRLFRKPIVVWLSLDKDRDWFDGKIRWNRFFKWVDKI